jgi:hypothetical protein
MVAGALGASWAWAKSLIFLDIFHVPKAGLKTETDFVNFRQKPQFLTPMPDYRLYFLEQSGHIYRAQELSAEDDSDACAKASVAANQNRWELWDRSRLIVRSDDYERRKG